jgi:hypothetical protein
MKNKTLHLDTNKTRDQQDSCFNKPLGFTRKGFFPVLLFLVALLFLGNESSAQERWNAAFRTGVHFPTTKLGTTELKTGYGFDGTIGYRVMPHLFLNAGWGWNRFASENNGKHDYEETGYILGFQFVHPIAQSKLSYVAGINAIYNHIEVENSNGDIISDTGHGWGWQADAGLGIQVGKRTKLIPSLRYRTLSRDLKIGNEGSAPVNLNYVSMGVGLSWSF